MFFPYSSRCSSVGTHATTLQRQWAEYAVPVVTIRSDRPHQLWQEHDRPHHIQGDAVMEQKLGDLHNDPVRRASRWPKPLALPQHEGL